MRPALKIIFAPLFLRNKKTREGGGFMHGQAQNRTIWLDPRSSEIGKTLLHEMIHIRYPSWNEQTVITETHRRWTKMGWKEKAHLLKLLGHAELEGSVVA